MVALDGCLDQCPFGLGAMAGLGGGDRLTTGNVIAARTRITPMTTSSSTSEKARARKATVLAGGGRAGSPLHAGPGLWA